MALSKSKLFVSFVVGVCFAVLAFVGVLYIKLKDISNLETLVAQVLSDRTHRTVKIGSAQLDYKNGVRIRLQDLTLEDPVSGRVVFAAGKVWLSVRPLPLLNREIKIRKITLEKAVFQVLRDAQGKFHFSSFQTASDSQTAPAEWSVEDFSFWTKAGLVHEMTLRQGELHFVDQYVSAGAEPTVTHVKNLSFTVAKPFLKTALKYTLEGELQGRSGIPAQINLFGKIHVPSQLEDLSKVEYEGKAEVQDLHMDDWRPYWDHWKVRVPPQHRVTLDSEFTGTLAGRFQSKGRLEHILGSSRGPPVLSDSAEPAHGSLDFDLTWVGDSLAFKQLAYRSGEWELDVTANFSDLTADRAKVSWALSTTNFPIANSEHHLPLLLLPAKLHEEIHELLIQGDVEIKSLEFNGFLDELSGEVSTEILRRFSGDLVLHKAELGRRILGLQDVDGTLSLNKGLATIKIARARYKGIPVQSLHAAINPFAQPARIEGTLETQLDLQNLKIMWLQEGSPGVFLNLLGSAVNLEGKARIRVRFQGPVAEPSHLGLQGTGVVADVGWDLPTLPWPVENAKGNFEFKRPELSAETTGGGNANRFWEVRFHNVSGDLGVNSIEGFDGNFVIDGETIKKRFTGKILISHIRAEELLPDSIEGRFSSLIKQVIALGGEITVNYQSRSNPNAWPVESTKGSLSIEEVTLLHTGDFHPLQRVSADVTFDDEKIILETRQAWYGESAIKLHVNFLNYKTPHPKLILKAVSPDFMQADFSGVPFLDRFEYEGPARMEFTLNATEDYFKFKKHLDLTRTSYKYQDSLVKPKDVANSIELYAEIKPDGLVFKDLIFDLGDIRVSGNGTLNGLEDPKFEFQLASKNLKTSEAAQYITLLSGAEGGTADFNFSGKGDFKHLDDAEFKGWIALHDVEYQHKDLLHSFILNTRVKFVNNRFNIQNASLVSDRSRLQVKGTYQHGPEPILKLALEGTSLYPVDFILQSGESVDGVVDWLGNSEWFMKGSGEVTMDLDHFYHSPWRLDKVAGHIIFEKGKLKTKDLRIGTSGKNLVRIKTHLSLEDPGKPKFKTAVMAREIPAAGFANIFGDIFYQGLSGEMKRFRAEIKGQGKNWREIAPTLAGRVSLNLRNGTIHTGRLLNGVGKLFGLPANPKEEAARLKKPEANYQEIMGDFQMTGGRATTENFMYGDAGRKVSLVGEFNLQHNTMKTVVGVAPMRVLDKFLKKIPLVGSILTGGKEQSLVKSYYKVAGPFDNPKIKAVPFTSLGKKVVGIFEGIVQTPKELFVPTKKATK